MKELIEKLNALQIEQCSWDWEDDLPEEIYEKYFSDIEAIASKIDVDKHRWYETSVSVYKLGDSFLGVESVTDVFSEQMGYRDCGHTLNFFEMEEFTTVYYRMKK